MQPQRGETQCVFCSAERMAQAFNNARSKGVVTSALRHFKGFDSDDVYGAERARIAAAMAKPRRTKVFVEQRKQARLDEESWAKLLARRQLVTAPASAEDKQKYQQRAREDKARMQRKFPALVQALNSKEETWRSPKAAKFEAWCREDAWTMCRSCSRMQTRPLREVDVAGKRGRQTHSVKQCKHCAHGVGYPTVQVADIPEVLRGLSKNSLWALTPLEVFSGEAVWAKHGYRVHTDMTRFWWRAKTVEDQIAELLDTGFQEDAAKAEAAYDYLMQAEDSSYRRFYDLHRRFLAKYQDHLTGEIANDWRVLQLPRACIEEVGIECALWPHLYPRTTMCETHVRASHHTRVGKPTRTVFAPKSIRDRDRRLREHREAAMGENPAQRKRGRSSRSSKSSKSSRSSSSSGSSSSESSSESSSSNAEESLSVSHGTRLFILFANRHSHCIALFMSCRMHVSSSAYAECLAFTSERTQSRMAF